jgi:hypothetical protein
VVLVEMEELILQTLMVLLVHQIQEVAVAAAVAQAVTAAQVL